MPGELLLPSVVLIPSPRGFCAGVKRAIDVTNQVIEEHPGEDVALYHEPIHNRNVTQGFQQRGAFVVNNLDGIPRGSIAIFSAHGVSAETREQAQAFELRTVDATCPLVTKVHDEVKRLRDMDYDILYNAHPGHDETIGTVGEAPNHIQVISTVEDIEEANVRDLKKVAYLQQTTLSMDDAAPLEIAFRNRFPDGFIPPKSDICYATQNRQDGVRALIRLGRAEAIIAVGDPESNNSIQLEKVAESTFLRHAGENQSGQPRTFFVEDASQVNMEDFVGRSRIGVVSGASTPEKLFQGVVGLFTDQGAHIRTVKIIDESFKDERRMKFELPRYNF